MYGDQPGRRLIKPLQPLQMKIITKRSKTQFHCSHANGSGVNEGTGVSPGVPDVPTYGFKDEQISWKSSNEDDDDEVSMSKDDDDYVDNEDDDGQDDDNKQTESDNDDLRVYTPSYFETTNDEAYDDVTQEDDAEEEMLDEKETNEEEEVNEMYRDANVNLERRDTEITDALLTNSSSVSSGFISNMLNPNPDTGIDFILNMNTESTSLVDVPVTTNVEMPPSYVTTLPPPPIPLIQPLQQTPVPTPTIVPTVSSIPGIIDKYLANQMNEAVKAAIQLQSDRLQDEAQAENEDFINKLDENIKKIIKEQVKVQVKEQVSKILPRIEKLVNEQLESEVLTCSSNDAKTSHAVATNLSELELKKILIDKMENNKSIDRSVQQKTLYKALVDAYETDKVILETYRDTVTLKRQPESTSAPKEKTSKSTSKSKEGSKSHQNSNDKSAQAEEPIHIVEDLEEPAHQEFNTGYTKDQPVDETTKFPDCNLAWKEDPRESFNELMDTPPNFLAFVLNRLKVNTLTPEFLAGLTFELMKGSCKSRVELEYFLKEVCKATTDQLDWNNPKGQQYPHDLRKPLPLIHNLRGRQVIPFDHFINNDLAYLNGGVSSQTYANSVTKTKAADYGHIKWIEDLVPNTMWGQVPIRFIYQNKDKKNRLIRIDELHKFSNGTLNDVRSALDDILKQIRMKYLPQTIWRNVDKERAGAMIQAIDQQLRNRRIIRSLEKFIGGRPHRYSNLMIQLELEGSTQGYPLVSVEILSHEVAVSTEGVEERKRIVRIKGEKKEALHTLKQKLDAPVMRTASAAAKPCQGDSSEFYQITSNIYTDKRGTVVLPMIGAANSRRVMIHSYMLIPDRLIDEVLKLKNFKKDATLKLFKIKYQERYEHVGPKVTSSQDGEMILCLVDDLKVFKITLSHTSQDKGTSSSLKSMITTSYSQENGKRKRRLRAQD
ncbi:hypothetical protein Tco_0484824 [Tanacetum coccineum]